MYISLHFLCTNKLSIPLITHTRETPPKLGVYTVFTLIKDLIYLELKRKIQVFLKRILITIKYT